LAPRLAQAIEGEDEKKKIFPFSPSPFWTASQASPNPASYRQRKSKGETVEPNVRFMRDAFHDAFGWWPSTLELRTMTEWAGIIPEDKLPEVVAFAFQASAFSGAKNWAYTEAVLKNLQSKGWPELTEQGEVEVEPGWAGIVRLYQERAEAMRAQGLETSAGRRNKRKITDPELARLWREAGYDEDALARLVD
jgi:hypothetical protein